MRTLRFALVALVAVALPSRARAQEASIIAMQIDRVIADVSDLRYADAIAKGREILASRAALTRTQEVELRSALAAAFFPDVGGQQFPDSALAQFVAVIRLAPDAEVMPTLAWPGLDSLLNVARARTFAVVLRPEPDTLTLDGGTPATLRVLASRPARFALRTRPRGQGREVEHSSTAEPAADAALSLRAHDGERILLSAGPHELVVVAYDPVRGDSTVLLRRVEVQGNAPSLVALPVLDSTSLQPERREPRQLRTAMTGLLFAGASVAVAHAARADEPIRSTFAPDARASLVGVGIIAATLGAMWMDRDGVDDEAVRYNAALRDAHERAFEAATRENRRRLAGYKATLIFDGEGR